MLSILLSLLLLGLNGVDSVLKVGVSELLSQLVPDFIALTPDGKCAPSFECGIIDNICKGLGEECEIVVLTDLGDRMDGVQRGDVDMSVSLISVTPERAEQVHFVRPYYYYAGVHLFTLDTTPPELHPDWSDIKDKTVCMLEDYYARSGVEFAYEPIIIEVANTNVSYILDGVCEYIVTESTDVLDGLVASSKALIEFGAPYGIAVSQEEREGLGAQVSAVLVDMMDDGLDSALLMIENSTLIAAGHTQNVKLLDVVLTITDTGGPIDPFVEDAIWDE